MTSQKWPFAALAIATGLTLGPVRADEAATPGYENMDRADIATPQSGTPAAATPAPSAPATNSDKQDAISDPQPRAGDDAVADAQAWELSGRQ